MGTRNSGTFQKGDARINRKGRPRSFDALRALGQQLANEDLTDRDGQPVIVNGHKLTRIEGIMRAWSSSKDPRLQMAFVEVAYGKVPNVTEVTGAEGGPVTFRVVYERKRGADGSSDNLT